MSRLWQRLATFPKILNVRRDCLNDPVTDLCAVIPECDYTREIG